jgi:RNA polymerase sigma-70 factor (ECF subfamily)
MKDSHLSDYRLVQKALKGDRHAFGEIVKKYESQVAKTVIGLLGNTMEADDVGQEVFIRFYKSMDQYKGDSALGTYLTRIAINLSLNELKRRKKKENADIDQYSYKLHGDDETVRKENVEMVTNALQELDTEFRSVIVLRMIRGYDTKETAEMLDLPAGTVLSRLSRGQKKLKEILKKEMIL